MLAIKNLLKHKLNLFILLLLTLTLPFVIFLSFQSADTRSKAKEIHYPPQGCIPLDTLGFIRPFPSPQPPKNLLPLPHDPQENLN